MFFCIDLGSGSHPSVSSLITAAIHRSCGKILRGKSASKKMASCAGFLRSIHRIGRNQLLTRRRNEGLPVLMWAVFYIDLCGRKALRLWQRA